jgi:hypothetical protein
MDLQLATTEDIANELLERQIRFVFLAIENMNTPRAQSACFSGKGVDHQDVLELFEFGREAFESGDDEAGDSDRMSE